MDKKKKIIIVSTITCVVFAAVIAILAFMWSKPINKFNRAVNEGKINQAVRIYNTSDNDEQYDMSDSILDKIDEYYDEFLNNNITYDEVVDFLKMVQHIENEDVNEKITIVNSKLNTFFFIINSPLSSFLRPRRFLIVGYRIFHKKGAIRHESPQICIQSS